MAPPKYEFFFEESKCYLWVSFLSACCQTAFRRFVVRWGLPVFPYNVEGGLFVDVNGTPRRNGKRRGAVMPNSVISIARIWITCNGGSLVVTVEFREINPGWTT